MADVLAVVLTIAFFAGAYGVALLCDRVIGPDADVLSAGPADAAPGTTDASADGTALAEVSK